MREFRKGEAAWFRRRVLRWFEASGRIFPWRHASATKYERIVAEVLLQRTKAETVSSVFRLFMATYPSWRVLSRAPVSALRKSLRPLGIWRRRAEVLAQLSMAVVLRGGRLPSTLSEAEELPGVGQYVACAILLFSGRGRYPLLDSNMARVLQRYLGPRKLADIRHDRALQAAAKQIVDTPTAIKVNWAILDLGALICRPVRPLCGVCPLVEKCDRSI